MSISKETELLNREKALFEKEKEMIMKIFEKEMRIFEKERELFEKEKVLFEKERELIEKEKNSKLDSISKDEIPRNEIPRNEIPRNETSEVMIPEFIQPKLNKNYWEKYAFEDLISEGDLGKLEWIKNNDGCVHFGVIHKAITHSNPNITIWFENNYSHLKTLENFKRLLKFDIRYNNTPFVPYSNLTIQVLLWYSDIFEDPQFHLNSFIKEIFEYAIKCHNSVIINYFEEFYFDHEKNFDFDELCEHLIPINLQEFNKYYQESCHKLPEGGSYHEDELQKFVSSRKWFKKCFGPYEKYDHVKNQLYYSK